MGNREPAAEQDGSDAIDFSVVIPTRNRPARVAQCLEALEKLDYPRDQFEVLLVDDGGTVDLETVVARVSQIDVRLMRQAGAGPASARNAGARAARGRWIAFTDDDCMPSAAWLHGFAEAARAHRGCIIGGAVRNALPDYPCSVASQLLLDYLYGYFNCEQIVFLTSNNLCVPKDEFLASGGFDESFPLAAAEDRELCSRWRRQGRDIAFSERALVDHAHYLRLAHFCRQHFRYGCGAYRFHRIVAADGGRRIEPEPMGFYAGLLRYPIDELGWWRGTPIAALFLVSQVANALGFFWEKTRGKR